MGINTKTKVYLGFLVALAITLYIYLALNFSLGPVGLLAFWSILAIVVESLLIPLPNNIIGVSVGYAINIATIIIGGPLLATTVAGLGFLCRAPKIAGRGYVHILNLPPHKSVFNVSQSIIVTALISLIYISFGGKVGVFSLIPTILILLTGVVINTSIISGFLSISGNSRFINTWIANIKGVFPSAVAVGTMGIIIALAFIGYGYGAVILFFGPLLLARYSFKLYIEMRNLYLSTIQALNKTVEAKDPYTSGHANRVEKFAVELAEAYHLPFESVQNIKTASILHDIGKIGINDSILNKATRLSQEEFHEIMRHPSIGADIISKVDFLKDITTIVKHHHERFDGKGYPDGLHGDEIPIEAAILTIADSYDAMTSDRPYRKALTQEEAFEELKRNAGTQFHPQLVETFISIMNH
ncbi:HD-GYP domain-containing protein [Gudongella oleilytica]|uniref:HD-GYP domain-containing protein n=1 Tax=Gudongella oleilytica TaxID=1582259 RepID=UPI000FF894A0|nr:HD-GYP domain-containing protein [Gudongella oleilytica]